MSRQFVNQLTENETVDEVFLVSEKQLRTNRNGNLYLAVRLSDKSGSLSGMMWNATERISDGFENGDYVRVHGTTQLYNGMLQMIVTRLEPVVPEKVIDADFVTLSSTDVDKLAGELADMLRAIKNYHLRTLAECCLADETFMGKFTSAPAGIKNHHAYRGGLLEHVLSLMKLSAVVAPHYEGLDSDLLLMGAFLHDIGKIDELTYERDLSYSDEGQLIGHIVMAVSMLEDKIRDAEKRSGETFPSELALRLKHMIVSHHGQYEFGSPKLPMTLEAIALHFLDNLDSKIYTVKQLIADDANTASTWTPYQPALGRKFYKGEEV
ncbi:MAG: HD domain-containing protein [Planctomycetaceae bacterium]|nr:HD domain-containing protein [Planctomycetales bacterium]MCB9924080.1 HD domain-containing protein [Planctomycetaceae bacterium]